MDSMNRRQFVGATAAVAAITLGARAAEDKIVRVGFIGVGGRGSIHLQNMLQVSGVAISAICDILPEHLKRAQDTVASADRPRPAGTAQWKELLGREDVDAVVSALPCDLHAQCYLDAIAAGKDLYAEKPMCITVADCNRVVEAAEASDRIVQIGFQRRFDPRFTQTIPQVHAGELGRIIEGRIVWSNTWGPLGVSGPSAWFGQRSRSGDWMVEQACHNWDVMNWANQSIPIAAVGFGHDDLFRDIHPTRDVHDYYSAVVQYPNGCIVNILHSWVPGSSFDTESTLLMGEKATLECNAGVFSYRPSEKKANRKGYTQDGPINSSLHAVQAFIQSVRTRQAPAANVRHGRDAVLACLLVRKAVYEQRKVTMEEVLANPTEAA